MGQIDFVHQTRFEIPVAYLSTFSRLLDVVLAEAEASGVDEIDVNDVIARMPKQAGVRVVRFRVPKCEMELEDEGTDRDREGDGDD